MSTNNYMQNPPLPVTDGGFGGFGNQGTPRWDQGIVYYDVPADNDWHQLRLIGPLFVLASHWIKSKKGKRFPVLCLNWDPVSRTFNKANGCPVCNDFGAEALVNLPALGDPAKEAVRAEVIKSMEPRRNGLTHCIPREIQQQQGGAFKSWRPIRLPLSALITLDKYKKTNKVVVNEVTYFADVNDPYYGIDVSVMHDPNAQNRNMVYQIIPTGMRTPLNPTEMSYLAELNDWAKMIKYPPVDEIKKSLVQNGLYQVLNSGVIMATNPGTPQVQSQVMPQMPASPINMTSIGSPAAYQQAGQTAYQQPMHQPQMHQPVQPMYQQPPVQQPMAAPIQQQSTPMQPPIPVASTGYASGEDDLSDIPFAPAVQQPMAAQYQQPQSMQHQPQMHQPVPPPVMAQQPVMNPTVSQPIPVGQPQQPMMAHNFPPPPPVNQVPVANNPVAPTADGEKRFPLVGQQNGVTRDEFQKVVHGYASTPEASPRSNPMKIWDKDDLAGMQVPACFSVYKSDQVCIKCPVRRYCIYY